MTDRQVPDWLRAMPKADLHCHMGGSIRIGTLLELADSYGILLPADTEEGIRKHVVFKDRPVKSLEAYLDCIKTCESVMVKPDAFRRVAYEIAQDAHDENVGVFELRFGPTNYRKEDLKLYEIVEATLDGLNAASRDFSMHTGLIICGIRTDMRATKLAVEIAINYQGKGVVGFDLAGKENGHPPKEFRDILLPVMKNFLPITIHAGEDGTVQYVAEAFVYLNAERIGHGVSIRESTKVIDFMNTTRKPIEICLTSNVDTGSVGSYETHPVRSYLLNDLRLAVSTDNRLISDTTVTDEYMVLLKHLGFSQKDIYSMAQRAIKSAFLNNNAKQQMLGEFDCFMQEYPLR